MSAEENKALVQRLHDGGIDVTDQYVDEDIVRWHQPGDRVLRGRDILMRDQAAFGAIFEGTRSQDHLVAEGDRVAYRWTLEGRYTAGPMAGRDIARSGINIVRIADGKVVEQWEVSDQFGPIHNGQLRTELPK